MNVDNFGKSDTFGGDKLDAVADDFQLGWNWASKGNLIPRDCSEQFANGFYQYIELHEQMEPDEVWAS